MKPVLNGQISTRLKSLEQPNFKTLFINNRMYLSVMMKNYKTWINMENKEAYIEKFNARIKALQADLDKLDAKARQSEADVKIKYQNEIEVLNKKKVEAQTKIDELKNISGGAWQDLKEGADKALTDLKTSWQSAMNKFKH
jgi:multidrug resistance efflux pump